MNVEAVGVIDATTEGADVDKRDLNGLEEVRLLTSMIREHQRAILQLAKKRRTRIVKLREHRITYREIAEAMGVTEQNVFKILKETREVTAE